MTKFFTCYTNTLILDNISYLIAVVPDAKSYVIALIEYLAAF